MSSEYNIHATIPTLSKNAIFLLFNIEFINWFFISYAYSVLEQSTFNSYHTDYFYLILN